MRKYVRFISIAVAGMLLAACGGKTQPQDSGLAAQENTPEKDTGAALSQADIQGGSVSRARKKEETVSIKTDPEGAPRETTVKVRLSGAEDGDYIEDRTDLVTIRNKEGDEEFLLDGNALYWEDHGEDIQYEGSSESEIPFGVKISYFLNGREVSPDEIAGKTGDVRIRFDYENRTEQTVTIPEKPADEKSGNKSASEDSENKDRAERSITMPVPVTAISMLLLPEKTFSDVKVKNGRLVTFGDQRLALGISMPGLNESLALADFEPTEDLEIPDYVEISAHAENFALDFTATIITPGLLSEIGDDKLDDLNELTDDMDELSNASGELKDGTQELYDGAKEFDDGLKKYVDGAKSLSSGAGELSKGTKELKSQSSKLSSGAKALADGLDELNKGVKNLDIGDIKLPDTKKLSALGDLDTEKLEALSSLDTKQLEALSSIDVSGLIKTLDGVDFSTLADNVGKASGKDAADQVRKMGALVPKLKAAAAALPQLQSALETVSELQKAADALGELQKAAEALSGLQETAGTLSKNVKSAQSAISRLSSGADTLSKGVDAFAGGISQLDSGASQLASGAGTLSSSGSKLTDGYSELLDGIKELKDGVAEFDEEGIQELTKIAGDDMRNVLDRIRAARDIDAAYNNFSGILPDQEGSVRFIFESDEI